MPSNPYRRPDHKTRLAREQGYPARSVFKLEEIDRRVHLLKPGMRVLDLGAAPGSWSMLASQRVGRSGSVLAVDKKPIDLSLGSNVIVVQEDALAMDATVIRTHGPFDVVLSDMAPSTTGFSHVDEIRSAELFMRAVDVADETLRPGGNFVGKLFMGASFEEARAHLRASFNTIRIIRPEGTRRSSVETFLVGLDRKRSTTDRL